MPPSHAEHNSDSRALEAHRPGHTQDSSHVYHQLTPQDWNVVKRLEAINAIFAPPPPGLPSIELVCRNAPTANHPQALNWQPIDRNHDGQLSNGELNDAIHNQHLINSNPSAVDTAVGLRANMGRIANAFHNPNAAYNLSHEDLDRLNRLPVNDPLRRQIDFTMETACSHGRKEELFSPKRGIVPDAVRQGANGDCTLLATLTSLATTERGRQFISQMVHDNGNGFTVQFANGQTIQTHPTSLDMAVYAHDSGLGTWPTVIEAAFGTARSTEQGWNPFWESITGNPRTQNLQLATESLMPEQVFSTIFNNRPTNHFRLADMSDESMHRYLTTVSGHTLAMVANTRQDPDVVDAYGAPTVPTSDQSIPHNHEYAIDHYDPSTRTVFLRNPWHAATVVRMPLSQFRQRFENFDAVYDFPHGVGPNAGSENLLM